LARAAAVFDPNQTVESSVKNLGSPDFSALARIGVLLRLQESDGVQLHFLQIDRTV
jgi:hypothetical protein